MMVRHDPLSDRVVTLVHSARRLSARVRSESLSKEENLDGELRVVEAWLLRIPLVHKALEREKAAVK